MEELRKKYSDLLKQGEGLDSVWDRKEILRINKEMQEILDKIIKSFGERRQA